MNSRRYVHAFCSTNRNFFTNPSAQTQKPTKCRPGLKFPSMLPLSSFVNYLNIADGSCLKVWVSRTEGRRIDRRVEYWIFYLEMACFAGLYAKHGTNIIGIWVLMKSGITAIMSSPAYVPLGIKSKHQLYLI